MGGQDCEPDISGVAFSPSGRRLYVGTEGGLAGNGDLDMRCCACKPLVFWNSPEHTHLVCC